MCAGVSAGLQERSRPLIADTAAAAAEVPPVGRRAQAPGRQLGRSRDVDPGAAVRVPVESVALGADRGDANRLRVRRGERVRGRIGTAVVAGARDDCDAASDGVRECSVQRRRRSRSRHEREGQVDHAGAVLRGPADPSGDRLDVRAPVRSEHLHRQDAAPAADAGCPQAVVEYRADQRCLLAAVAVLVRRVGAAVDRVEARQQVRSQVRVAADAGVDDRDHDARIALRDPPRLWDRHRLEPSSAQVVEAVVRDERRRLSRGCRKHRREDKRRRGDEHACPSSLTCATTVSSRTPRPAGIDLHVRGSLHVGGQADPSTLLSACRPTRRQAGRV